LFCALEIYPSTTASLTNLGGLAVMKKIRLAFTTSLVLTVVLVLFGFTSAQSPQAEFDVIRQGIPNNWWEGNWDKINELKEFVSKHGNSPNACAQARYYLGCNYKVQGDYTNALKEYNALINAYPQVTSECSKAQFEIAQIYFYCLNDIPKAIVEYKKMVAKYPNSWLAPLAEISLGRAYRRQKDYTSALAEYQKIIDNYPDARKQRVEAYMDMGDIAKDQGDISKAISNYKKAYLACPFGDTETMQWTVDVICEALRTKDGSMASANQFLKYQKYGPPGEDKIAGTSDDLTNPLAAY